MTQPDEDTLFGELLIRQGLARPEHVTECLKQRSAALQRGEKNVPKLAQLLVARGYLTVQSLQATLKFGDTPSTSAHTVGPLGKASLPEEAATAFNEPANRMGKYIRVKKVGTGGMGEVWKAWDTDLDRWAALKFLHNDNPEELAKFFHEARIAAKLNHPNIASVYEVGRLLDKPFIAMQFVDGWTFNAAFRKKEKEAARAIRDAAFAVQYSHEQGVIHRDIKPANLMVESSTRVYVMDFGLAKQLGLPLSGSGTIWGTPAYMSPEQAQGLTLTVSSDIYSLGATLYELVTGKAPFHGENVYQILARVVERAPMSLHALVPGVSRELETIVLKCLEKDPAARYGTAKALAEDLDRYLNGEEVLAHPPSMLYRFRKLAERRRGIIAAALLGAVAMTIVAVVLLRSAKGDQASLQELGGLWSKIVLAKQGFQNASLDPRKVMTEIRDGVKSVDDYLARDSKRPQGHFIRAKGLLYLGETAAAEKSLRTALSIASDFTPGQALLGRVLLERYFETLRGGASDSSEERRRLAEPLLREAGDLLDKASNQEQASLLRWGLVMTREDRVADVLSRVLRVYFIRKDHAEARKMLNEADRAEPSEEYSHWMGVLCGNLDEEISHQTEAIVRMAHYAKAWQGRGDAHLRKGDHKNAMTDLDQALRINPRMVSALVSRGLTKHFLHDWPGAIADATSVLEIDPTYAGAYVNRGNSKRFAGNLANAIDDYDEALRINPDFTVAHAGRANAHMELKDWTAARRDCDAMLRINPKSALAFRLRAKLGLSEETFGAALRDADQGVMLDPKYDEGYSLRAVIRTRLGDTEGAMEDVNEAIKLDPRNGSSYGYRGRFRIVLLRDLKGGIADIETASKLGSRTADSLAACGSARQALGDRTGAMRDYNEALRLDPDHVGALVSRGSLHGQSNDLERALRDLETALRIDPRRAAAYLNRGFVRKLQGDLEGASSDFDEAMRLDPRDSHVYEARGMLRFGRHEYRGALEDLTEAIRLDPKDPQLYGSRGNVYGALRDDASQIADFERALELAPADWYARGPMADCLKQLYARRKQ